MHEGDVAHAVAAGEVDAEGGQGVLLGPRQGPGPAGRVVGPVGPVGLEEGPDVPGHRGLAGVPLGGGVADGHPPFRGRGPG